MTKKPHNNFFTFVFSQKDLVQDFLTQLVPQIASKIDIDSLELDDTTYVNTELDELYSDIVYNVQTADNKAIKIALLFEHKSYPELFPRLQLMEYMLGIWRKNPQENQTLIPIVPIIFYHGERKWHYKNFEEHFDVENTFEPFLPKFDYCLIDLANYSDGFILSLKKSFLVNSLIAFKHKNDDEYVRRNYTKIFINLEDVSDTEIGSNYIHILSVYIISSTKINSNEMIDLIEKLPPAVGEKAKTTAQQLFEKGVKQGIEKGIEKGIEQGIEVGRREKEIKTIKVAIKLLSLKLEIVDIHQTTEVPTNVLQALQQIYTKKKATKAVKLKLAKDFIQYFKYLTNNDISNFVKLKQATVEQLRNEKNAKES